MKDEREILYDTQWQYFRLKLRAAWAKQNKAHANLAKLQVYLDGAGTSEQELYMRLHRVVNLLRLLPEARRDIRTDAIALEIALFAQAINPLYTELHQRYPLESLPDWDEQAQYRQLKALRQNDPTGFQKLLADISGRFVKLPKGERNLMERYLSLMRKVSNETLI